MEILSSGSIPASSRWLVQNENPTTPTEVGYGSVYSSYCAGYGETNNCPLGPRNVGKLARLDNNESQ